MDLPLILFLLIFTSTGISLTLLWYFNISFVYAIIAPAIILLIVYVVVPLIFRCSPNIQRGFVYQHKNKLPPVEADLSDPASFGIAGSRNIYLSLGEGHHVGVWHILPQHLIEESQCRKTNDDFWKLSLTKSTKPIIIYFHGNTGTRALDHRKELYWLFQNNGYHVIAFDYRGFGDSSSIGMNEETTVQDGLFVYNWVSRLLMESGSETRIIVWGHSLGTAIASSTIAKLYEVRNVPSGLILESPFTNIGEAMQHHRKAKLYRRLPYFHWLFTHPLRKNKIAYKTDHHIVVVKNVPTLILHSQDDETVPIKLGRKLFDIGFRGRFGDGAKPIYMREFVHGHGHKFICRSPELLPVVESFIASL